MTDEFTARRNAKRKAIVSVQATRVAAGTIINARAKELQTHGQAIVELLAAIVTSTLCTELLKGAERDDQSADELLWLTAGALRIKDEAIEAAFAALRTPKQNDLEARN